MTPSSALERVCASEGFYLYLVRLIINNLLKAEGQFGNIYQNNLYLRNFLLKSHPTEI